MKKVVTLSTYPSHTSLYAIERSRRTEDVQQDSEMTQGFFLFLTSDCQVGNNIIIWSSIKTHFYIYIILYLQKTKCHNIVSINILCTYLYNSKPPNRRIASITTISLGFSWKSYFSLRHHHIPSSVQIEQVHTQSVHNAYHIIIFVLFNIILQSSW